MILTRTFTSDLHVRDDDRVISGTLVPYGQPVQIREYGKTYTEDFAAGAFAADVDRASEIELTALHPRSGAELPIGITLSLTDTPTGLDGEWRVSETEFGTEVLTLGQGQGAALPVRRLRRRPQPLAHPRPGNPRDRHPRPCCPCTPRRLPRCPRTRWPPWWPP